jgi:hypothetical protein
MSDWIDRLKTHDQSQEEARKKHEETLHEHAKLIRSKAPAFWMAVIELLKADCAKLQETFPNDKSRQCDLIQTGNSCRLQSKKLPFTILELSLNLDGKSVDVDRGTKSSRYDTQPLSKREVIQIKVFKEEVVFEWRGSDYSTPALLAERLIKEVCGISR